MHAIFDFIIKDNVLERTFLKYPDQKKIIMTLANLSLEKCNFFDELECMCGENIKNIVPLLYSVFSNILLNNYTKQKTDASREIDKNSVENKTKKRNLNTFK